MATYANSTHVSTFARTGNEMIVFGRVLTLILAGLFYAALSSRLITDFEGLGVYTVLLLGYLGVEIKNLWSREPELFWINPVVLASILTFALAFGVTNILYFMPDDVVALVGLQPIATPWMNQLMLLVVLGACAMWVGFSSGIGRSLGQMLQRSRVLRKWISSSVCVNPLTIAVFLTISFIARLWMISLEVYGYSSSYEILVAAAAYTQYFTMAESLGRFALVAVAIQCFSSPRSSLADRQILWYVLGFEVAFGFLSGFKSAVVMPFIIVGLVYYSQRNRFPRWLMPAVVVGVMAAYAVIEPFRAARNENTSFSGTSVDAIMTAMPSLGTIWAGYGGEGASTALSLLARNNLTYVGSLGIEYAANNELSEDSPEFLRNIIFAPAYAFVPRLLWDTKPMQTTGLWYTNEVLGFRIYSSTAMSPFTYLNFAGGPFAVILGFLIVGIVQRGLFEGVAGFGGGGLIVVFGLLGTLANVDSAFDTFFVGVFRFLPLLIIVQYLLLHRLRPQW